VSLVDDIDKDLAQQPELIRFRCLVGDQQIEEIIAYDQIGEFVERQTEVDEGTWRYRAIIGHQGPFTARDKKEYRGSPYDLLIEWETGECAYEPLCIFYKDNPVDVALCARDNDLIEEFHSPRTDIKKILKREKKKGSQACFRNAEQQTRETRESLAETCLSQGIASLAVVVVAAMAIYLFRWRFDAPQSVGEESLVSALQP